MNIIVVPHDHELRATTEHFISEVYETHYQASVPSYPPVLIGMFEKNGELLCASGLRFAQDGFFSEAYLDISVERALAVASGKSIAREDIFEVTTLASRAPRVATRFLRQIVAFGELSGFEWAFFTATDRLREILRRIDLPLLTLTPADPARIANPAVWGSYYAASPCVCAVKREAAASFLFHDTRSELHA
jgi:hypothetical protein